MLKPGGSLSWAVGSLSAAAGSGGGATGASLLAASLPSGRPISGEPGGSAGAAGAAIGAGAAGAAIGAGAAAGGAAAGGAEAGWAKTGAVNRRPAIVPASNRLRRAVRHGIIEVLPEVEALDPRGPIENGPERAPISHKSPPFDPW